MYLESAINCGKEDAYAQMLSVKMRFQKLNGVLGYHMIQSFQEGEVTPELAHQIGVELTQRLLGDRYQAVIATHLNTDNIHNHIVFNSVDCVTGEKFHINERGYYEEIRGISDALCREHGLSVIDPQPGSRGKKYAELQAEREGRPTFRSILRDQIDEVIASNDVFSAYDFVAAMEEQGYQVDENPRRRYVTVLPPGAERPVRLSEKLGDGYSFEDICARIAQKQVPSRYSYEMEQTDPGGEIGSVARAVSHRKRPIRMRVNLFKRSTLRSAFSLRGLRGLYFQYLYRMGVLPKNRPARPEVHAMFKRDIQQLDQRIRMANYLFQNNIHTVSNLHARQAVLLDQTKPLVAERKKLYRKPGNEDAISEINQTLKPIWKEVHLCQDVEKHSLNIHKKLSEIRELEQARYPEKWMDQHRKDTRQR